jgi:hypothetical protein
VPACRPLPLSLHKTNLALLLSRRPDGIFIAPFEQGEIGPDLFRAACNMGLEGLADLFDSDDFPVPIPDPEAAAEIVIQ